MVGDAQRALAVELGRQHQLLDPRRAVEHRVLGVVVEVDELLTHVDAAFRVRANSRAEQRLEPARHALRATT